MMRRILLLLSVLFLAFRGSDKIQIAFPGSWPKPEHRMQFDADVVLLGRMLFYDPMLSADGLVSCASCHSPYNSFAHTDHALSHGIDDRIGFRNAPALINLAWRKDFMWDGRFSSLEEQIRFPVDHPDEMGSSFDSLPMKLQKAGGYGKFFASAFGDPEINIPRILEAFSQFTLSLVSGNSKYDQMKKGKLVFTEQESNGYRVFQESCGGCHREPLFTSNQYARNGLTIDSALHDYGRMRVTGDPADSMRFRVPTLRNIEYTYPYMHDGRYASLWQVLNHYQQTSFYRADLFGGPLNNELTDKNKVDLMAFLLTLSDREFVYGSKHGYPTESFNEKKQLQSQSLNTY